jgi:hypothetical protein
VGARVETVIRAHEGPGADSDGAVVDGGGVEAEEDADAELGVAAIVDVDGGVYPGSEAKIMASASGVGAGGGK